MDSNTDIQFAQNTDTIPMYEVLEITFLHEHHDDNPFFDVTIEGYFTSPGGHVFQVGGFYYGPASQLNSNVTDIHREDNQGKTDTETWKVRFAPDEIGEWHYKYLFTEQEGNTSSGSGKFVCVKGKHPQSGFVRPHPTNPFRWVYDDGTPYYPIGTQDCWGDNNKNGSVLDQVSMEGPFRTDLKNPPTLPPGPLFGRGPAYNPQNGDVMFRHFSRCGFNLFRFSQQNCSFSMNSDLDHYLVQEGRMTDELIQCVRKYNFRIMYGLFGYQPVFNDTPGDQAGMEKVKRFVKYSVNRWGAYIDFWEFLNEQKASDAWYAVMIPYLQSIDPYHHPITTSWEHPELDGIEINAPHWYQKENELESDRITADRAESWKKCSKPVIVGEQGNHIDKSKPQPPGVGGVWDDRSAMRMRIRCWSAFFNEIAFVFWNTSYAKDGHNMNLWLGPKEREYVRALQDFAYAMGRDIQMIPVSISDAPSVRAYGLSSKERVSVYLHHYNNHDTLVNGLKIHLNVPHNGNVYWYNTENAMTSGFFEVAAGENTLEVPEFIVDLALIITPDSPPDIDKDGQPNHLDLDNDNDGVNNDEDAFPLEPEEWRDRDGDWIGDNMDADDNNDGIGDDENKNSIPDYDELDFDGDKVDRAKSIPWDAFPFNPTEWRDTDGDGIGDNQDQDDDNDGWSDIEEQKQGTHPLDKLSFPYSDM